MKFRLPVFILILVVLLAATSLSIAQTAGREEDPPANRSALDEHGPGHHRHGGLAGGLPQTSQNVKLVGKASVKKDAADRVADVAVFGDYAYLAAFRDRLQEGRRLRHGHLKALRTEAGRIHRNR